LVVGLLGDLKFGLKFAAAPPVLRLVALAHLVEQLVLLHAVPDVVDVVQVDGDNIERKTVSMLAVQDYEGPEPFQKFYRELTDTQRGRDTFTNDIDKAAATAVGLKAIDEALENSDEIPNYHSSQLHMELNTAGYHLGVAEDAVQEFSKTKSLSQRALDKLP